MKKTIPVIGMACSVCSANVEKKLQSLEGINSASVSLASRTALVDYDPDIISLEDMKREISNAGYDLVIENDRSVEEINRREFTLLRRRTLTSWLFAILTMCFSMGWISLGMEQNMISDGVASAHHTNSFANQIWEIKREKLTKTIKVLASFSLFIYTIQVSLLQNIDISLILYQFRI
jgi:P-type Cu2+ transporter